MPSSTILITGATGFIGAHVVRDSLGAGYTVRLSIRRARQATQLRQLFPQYAGQLDFVVVPDITENGAFDDALQGVTFVFHLASPMGTPGDQIAPAVQGTLSLLESAAKQPSIRKVVITASVLSFMPLDLERKPTVIKGRLPSLIGAPNPLLTSLARGRLECDAPTLTLGPAQLAALDPISQYHASKIASYDATAKFFAARHPHFTIVNLHPVYVYGPNLHPLTSGSLGGANGFLLTELSRDNPFTDQFSGVHVSDVAAAHLKALDYQPAGIRSYLLAARDRPWSDVHAFLDARYAGSGFKLQPRDSVVWRFDAGRAQRELGLEFREMEAQVGDAVEQHMALQKQKGAWVSADDAFSS